MAERTIDPIEFRKIFGDVPELTTPANMQSERGEEWPFEHLTLISERYGRTTGVLETGRYPGKSISGRTLSSIKVEYEQSYGPAVQKYMYLDRLGKRILLNDGSVRYSFGNHEVVYAVSSSSMASLVLGEGDFRDPQQFHISIDVCATPQTGERFPLARANYEPDPIIPIQMQFPYADYADAAIGNVEKPLPRLGANFDYRSTYGEWEDFVGAIVGHTKYSDEQRIHSHLYPVSTIINDPQMTEIPDTPYQAKFSRSKGRSAAGRFRLARRDKITGEKWMLSVPERINKQDFIDALLNEPLYDFLCEYPVRFCVKQQSGKTLWLDTYKNWKKDQAR